MKPYKLLLRYLFALFTMLLLNGCTDDFPYYGEIPEGEGNLSATITFTPASGAILGGTRTPGDAIKSINSLCVFVYSTNGELIRKYSSDELIGWNEKENHKDYEVKPGDHLDGTEAHPAETTTTQVTFQLPGLPYGRYHMYAVANMGDMNNYDDETKTETGLKNIRLNWNYNTIADNNQMFGYFTPSDNMESEGFDAHVLEFRPETKSIHAWLKRVVSKVTIAFDPSGLNQDIWIYIKNVTIRDIPKTCLLGAENTPSDTAALYNHMTTPYSKPDYKQQSAAYPNTRFEYDSEGLITDPSQHTGTGKTDGYMLTNKFRSPIPDGAHTETAPALFFFENNQGEKKTEKDKDKYDKRQWHSDKEDGVGTPIRDNKDDEGNIIDNDLKDRVPYGTYIEVEAYYISNNSQKVGEGSIKYRFMLGKDILYNYDAQRNYHFKVTLGFNGWANEPDWHIDYELPEPGIEVPPVFRVSYIYHQKSDLPIRILGDCVKLRMDIIENNWGPYDSVGTTYNGVKYFVPDSVAALSPDRIYAFRWNRDAYFNEEYMQGGKEVPYFGFLSLRLPNRNTTTINQDYGSSANKALVNYYTNQKEGWREFIKDASKNDFSLGIHTDGNTDDDYYVTNVYDDLNEVVPNQATLMVPLWTRAKTLITDSGFSGNNPYEGYERKAVVRITATFSDNTVITKDVTVLQVKRLVNPKGIWRAYDSTNSFDVTLLESESGNDKSNFRAFASEGAWSAFFEESTNMDKHFKISPNGKTNGYMNNDTIFGYTGSNIDFKVIFDGEVGENVTKCAILKVLYHGNQCLHKIYLRHGYNEPVKIGNTEWSSFSLYRAEYESGNLGDNDVYKAELTKNPLALGSMFRRRNQKQGIFVSNNENPKLGPFMPPGNNLFTVGEIIDGDTTKLEWSGIEYQNDVLTANANKTFGTFIANGWEYRVPTYAQFQELSQNAEYGFGVFYGSSALEPALNPLEAYGLIDPGNKGLFDSEMGMRGVVVYDKTSGNQVFFPVGKYGTGRRNNFIMLGDNAGVLRYGDVYYLLTIAYNENNLYRPIPYNLMVQSGNVYWIDKFQDGVRPQYTNSRYSRGCLGWDLNYFNFDFNPYTANCYRDALPIKLIRVGRAKTTN